MAEKKSKAQYVNNKDFLAAFIVYREDVAKAKEENKPRPMALKTAYNT
mgnify:CR=1 FL=1